MNAPMYVAYHVHSMLSNGTTNIDSITDFHDYVDIAKSYGMPALGISEHGNIYAWLKKKEAIEAAGMKYLHCVEAYITEDTAESTAVYCAKPDIAAFTDDEKKWHLSPATNIFFQEYWQRDDGVWVAKALNEKDAWREKTIPVLLNTKYLSEYSKKRDNYHCVLIAKNYEGVKEINRLVSESYNREDFHFYYAPRICLDDLIATSKNILITTACLGSMLHNGSDELRGRVIPFLQKNKDRCFLEIQHHNCPDQIEYNQYLYQIHKATGVPLIAGTDTHALNDSHMDGRAVLQKAKDVKFSNEDEWDMTFKSPEELWKAYQIQNSLPMDVVQAAIHNTICLADMVEEFKLDYSPKYPRLYDNSEEVFKQKINEGVKWRGIQSKPNYRTYLDRIHYEYDTYVHNGAVDFMLLEEDYKAEMRRRGIKYGYSRGSVSGSIIAYLLGITEIDSVKYNLNFERFMNRERISLADIDSDWYSEDREIVKDYLFHKQGLYCCDIVTFNTIALKGAIDDVCRALYRGDYPETLQLQIENDMSEYGKIQPSTKKEAEKYDRKYLDIADQIKSLAESDEKSARKKYPDVFKYVDLVNGVVVSVGNHPAGCVVSPFPVDEWFGTFTSAGDQYPIAMLNMKEIDSLNFVKLDILGLDNIGLIYKTCEAAGIPFLTPDNTPPDDMDVWNSIREDTTMIFQWESPSATAYLKHLFSDSTVAKIKEKNPNFTYMDLFSIGNGAIRPAGESYRDELAQGIYQDNGHSALDEFMKPTLGYCVYQEQVIEFLHSFCGYTMGAADLVRRAFSKKLGTEKHIPQIKSGFIKTMKEKYDVPENESETLVVNFLQVIEDASDYLFSKNHADPYSWIGYICGYLRYHYPLEFISTALNIFKDNIEDTLAITDYAKKQGIKISSIKFRNSQAEYSFDKETNQVYKGLASIKFISAGVAEYLYELRNNTYSSFAELLVDVKKKMEGTNKSALNARQIEILIKLDFFEEFGDAKYLLAQYDLFDKYYGRSQFSKKDISSLGIPEETIRKYSGKETEKMFTKVDSMRLIKALSANIQVPRRTLSEKIKAQNEYLGYIDIADPQYSRLAAVLSVDTKYAPKVKLHSLKNGTTMDCKIDRRTFNKTKLQPDDIIRVLATEDRPRSQKDEDGNWVKIPGTKELWITDYQIIKGI